MKTHLEEVNELIVEAKLNIHNAIINAQHEDTKLAEIDCAIEKYAKLYAEKAIIEKNAQ